MVKTSFWSPSGKPMSAQEFVVNLFEDIPSLFTNEKELRKIWSIPSTRKKLLEELNEKGYTREQLQELKRLVNAESCDLYDVLTYIAYSKDMQPRVKRAARAKTNLSTLNGYSKQQQDFLSFVLGHYVDVGVSELDDRRLKDLLVLRYHALNDAKEEQTIRDSFIGFQKYLYV